MSLSIQYFSTTIKEGNESETEKHSFNNALKKATNTIFSIQQPSTSKPEKKPLTSYNEIIPDEKDQSIFTFTPKKKPNFEDPMTLCPCRYKMSVQY
jgi:hypothetical protein